MTIPKVLLVNDDPASLLALESLLTAAPGQPDYELLTAGSGRDALRQVLRHDFAVILLDVGMPGMDGFETAAAIHAHPRSATLPIIFITAHHADEIDRLRAYQNGAADYLFTPVIPQVLRTKVAVFVELTRNHLQLRRKTEQLERLHQDLQVQRLRELERANAELQAEVAERKLAEQRAHDLSIRDALTGLLNRRALIQHLEHAVASADRQRSEFALLFLDLDRFKAVNDTLGHEVGDELLRQVAARLSAAVRVSDVVARLGGDEFVVLVEGKAAAANAARVARKIGLAQARPYDIGGHRVQTSSSIGIGLYPQDGGTAPQLMKNADLAMYHAKQERRGSIQFFHQQLNQRERERELWRRELRAALDGGQFALYYQPLAEIDGGRLAGLEVLLHWDHPRLGCIAAEAFLPEVPDRLLLEQIDDWVLAAACAQAARWRQGDGGGGLPPLALNLACARLRPELPELLLAQLARHGIGPRAITLELPEPLLCAAFDEVEPVLRRLRAAGIRVAVDHFGSGGAALAVCQALALDALKIERGFVETIGSGSDSGGGAGMAGAIVLLARALALDAVALGVADSGQLAQLKNLGCRHYQGPLLCAPLPAAAVEAYLAGHFAPAPAAPAATEPSP